MNLRPRYFVALKWRRVASIQRNRSMDERRIIQKNGVECSSFDLPDEDGRAMLGTDSSGAIRVATEADVLHSSGATLAPKHVDSNERSSDDSQQWGEDRRISEDRTAIHQNRIHTRLTSSSTESDGIFFGYNLFFSASTHAAWSRNLCNRRR